MARRRAIVVEAPRRARGRSRAPTADPWLVRLVLGVVGRLRWVLRLLRVHPDHVLELLRLRLLLDVRPRPFAERTGMAGVGLALILVMMLFMGLFSGWLLLVQDEPLWGMTWASGLTLVWFTLMLILEHGERLVDSGDNALVLPTPVSERTLLFTRMLHVVVYMSLLLSALCLPVLVAGLFRFPPWIWAPVYLLSVVLIGALGLGLLLAVLMLTLRTVGLARFRTVAAWIQGTFVLLVYLGMYAGRPLLHAWFDIERLEAREAWLLLMPPAWFGGLLEAALGSREPVVLGLAALALVVPPALLLLALGLARGVYAHALAQGAGAGRDATWHTGLQDRLGRRLTRPGAERAGWLFFACMARREHRFQMRVLPMFAMFVSMTALYALQGQLGTAVAISLPLYFLVVAVMTVHEAARWGEHPEARWLFDASPQRDAGPLLAGSHKGALLIFVALPAAVYVPLVGWAHGPVGWWQAGFAVTLVLLLCVAMGFRMPSRLPFSARFRKEFSSSNVASTFLAMFLAGGLAAGHWLLSQVPRVQAAVHVGLLAGLALLWWRLGRRRARWPEASRGEL